MPGQTRVQRQSAYYAGVLSDTSGRVLVVTFPETSAPSSSRICSQRCCGFSVRDGAQPAHRARLSMEEG